jgi:hypothetical protein
MDKAGAAGKLRPVSIDFTEFEDCYDEHQWWHYQAMADNAKDHAQKTQSNRSSQVSTQSN